MRYESRITAYDCLDQCVVSIVVYGIDDDDPTRSRRMLGWSRQYRSRGENDPTRWILQLLQETVRDLDASEKRRPLDDAPPLGVHTVPDVAKLGK